MLLRLLLLFFLPLLVLCAEDYYKLLGVDKSASDRELKKAYRGLSKKFHPDKNPGDEGAHQKFVEIAEAYEVLSTEETRHIYDKYGHDGLEKHKQTAGRSHGGHDPFDLFSRFFGGGGHYRGGERKGPNMEARIAVPLKAFYTGTEQEFTLEKQVICDTCDGSGSQDGKKETCSQCSGRGAVIQKLNLAPGIFQQVQSTCPTCSGSGKVVRNPCKVCHGSRVVREKQTLTLVVEPGLPRGARLTYENEADASPEYEAGDLLVSVMEQEPANVYQDEGERTDGTFFRRKGKDLFWREALSLREAWMGEWTRNLTHLDGHTVQLSRPRGQVVQPNMVELVAGEGMPIWHEHRKDNDPEFGNLHVEYIVILPDQMDKGMEKEFHAVWDKWRRKAGVDLHRDSGRPPPLVKDEL